MMFLGELVTEVVDLLLIAVNLVVLDITKIVHDIELFGKRFADIPTDVIHSGGPRMVQPSFEPVRVSTKLTHTGTNEQVFQISGTLVACVLMAQCVEVGQGNKFPHGLCFVLTK